MPEKLTNGSWHWHIENRLFWGLGVTFWKTRQHAHNIGLVVHFLQSVVIRRQGFATYPTAAVWLLLALSALSLDS